MTNDRWLWTRLIALGVVALASPFLYNDIHAEFENQTPSWGFIAAMLGFGVAAVLFPLAIQTSTTVADEAWSKPSWRANPFDWRQPVQSFHFGGWLFVVLGISTAIYALAIASRNFMFVLPLSVGVGVLLGVKFAVVAFRRKFEPEGNAA